MTKGNDRKKELQSLYKERKAVGGVYLIRNIQNKKIFLDATLNLQGIKNRFEFAQKTGSCVYTKLQKDWSEQGGGQFAFESLEELVKSDSQTQTEFKSDVELLKEIWREKLSDEEFY